MNQTFARRSTWIVIALVLLIGGGAYFWLRTRAATTVGSDAPSFQADLKNTLALQAGVGSPTFTRATTATVTDFEGLIKTVKSGEARFEGARRVENLVSRSESFSNPWTFDLAGGTLTDNGDGSHTITWGGSSTDFEQLLLSSTGLYNRSFLASIYVKATGSNIGKNTGFKLRRISGTGYESSIDNFTLTGNWQRISIPVFTGLSDTVGIKVELFIPSSNPASSVIIKNSQVEDVTGQANQNPSEYVSTNVLSAPYHGANVDGVQYFTTQNGNTVASNVVTEATGANISDATLHGYVAEGQRTNLIPYSRPVVI